MNNEVVLKHVADTAADTDQFHLLDVSDQSEPCYTIFSDNHHHSKRCFHIIALLHNLFR